MVWRSMPVRARSAAERAVSAAVRAGARARAAEAATVDGRALAEGAVVGVLAAGVVGVVVPLAVHGLLARPTTAAALAVTAARTATLTAAGTAASGGRTAARRAVLGVDDAIALEGVVAVAVDTALVGLGAAGRQ